MRRFLICVTVALISGCWGNPVSQDASCGAWVGCIRALDAPSGEPTNLDRFEPGGFCWNNPLLADGCIKACTRALSRLRERETSLPVECQP